MAKKITRVKRRYLKIEGLCFLVFGLSLFAWMFSSIFLRAYNVQLSVAIQKTQTEIVRLNQSNEVLNVEIQNLSSKDRVMAIAKEAGLSVIQENVIIVRGE